MEERTKAAIKQYESYMAKYIEDDIHTDAEIRQQHKNALAIINSYKIRSIIPPNQWHSYMHQISDYTTDREKFFIQSNQDNVDNQVLLRNKIMLQTLETYEEVLCRYHGTVGNAAQLSQFLPISQTFSWGVYQRKAADNNLPHASWQASVFDALNKLKTKTVPSPSDSTPGKMKHEDFMKKFKKMNNSLFPGSFALILHHETSSVRGAVYKTEKDSNTPEFLHQWPFFIVFKGDQTLINMGESDALKSGGINLNEELTSTTQKLYTVAIRNQEEILELEEILSMYFYKAKREIETKLNVAFTSCVMVISPYLSTRGKHILKTSLYLAGFQNTALLHSTTATDLGLEYPPTNSVRANTRDETILWGAFQSTNLQKWNKKVIEVSKVSSWANRSKQNIESMDILRYIPEKLKILSDDKIIKLISVNDQLPKKSQTVYFGKYDKITLCEMLGDGPNNSDQSHHIATISKGERLYSWVSIEVEFSPEGLVQITSTPKASESPSQSTVHIQLSYMGPQKISKSKKMLWTNYFRDKNYFEISWKQFLEKTQRFEEKEQSGNGDVGSGSTTAQEQSQLELQRLLKQLKVYAEKVEAAISNSNSVTNERILEKIREDLQHCQRFLRETGPNTQVRDGERQLTKLKISTSTLNIL